MTRRRAAWGILLAVAAMGAGPPQPFSDCVTGFKPTADRHLRYRERPGAEGSRCEGLVVVPDNANVAVRSVRLEAPSAAMGKQLVVRPAEASKDSRLHVAVEGLDVNYRLDMRNRPFARLFRWPAAIARQALAGARALTPDDLDRLGVLVQRADAQPDEYVAAILTADADAVDLKWPRILRVRLELASPQSIDLDIKPVVDRPVPRGMPQSTRNAHFVEFRIEIPKSGTYSLAFQTTSNPAKTLTRIKVIV